MTSLRSNCIKHCCLLLFPCPGGPAPQPQRGGCNGAGAGASADRGAIPRSFRVLRRIQSGLSRVESPLLQPCLLESGLRGQVISLTPHSAHPQPALSQFKPEPQPRHICAPSPEAERGTEKGGFNHLPPPNFNICGSNFSPTYLWKQVPEKRKAERSTRISRESLQEVASQ